jgi:S1-C subfamily serine protease
VSVDAQGDILTSLHVVANATEITVTFADGMQSSATVAVRQPENDIAVLTLQQKIGLQRKIGYDNETSPTPPLWS